VYNDNGDFMINNTLLETVKIVLTTFIFVMLITPYIKNIANHIGAVDVPDERKVHKSVTARLGGLGIFFGFLFGYMLFGESSSTMNSILISSFIVVITGVVDDIKPLKPSTKFLGQLISALIIVFYGGLLIDDVTVLGSTIVFGYLAIPLTIFFILGCINCINLIDGLDGLSSGIASIYFLTIGLIIIVQGFFGLEYVLSFVMLGSTLGFLVHNFNPASIFIGDSGSMFLGLIISVIALLGFKNVTLTSFFIPLLLLAIPILDTSFAILRRVIKGEKISKPDKFHIHHQFLNNKFSVKETVLIIYAINLLFAAASIFISLNEKKAGYVIYIILFLIVTLFILKTNVIIEKEKFKIFKKKSF
jgi:UDP-GlcNAc:undecaprenyl-phosphate/decaprenyl-phosphate GlcNAc-1-phosphate transferase